MHQIRDSTVQTAVKFDVRERTTPLEENLSRPPESGSLEAVESCSRTAYGFGIRRFFVRAIVLLARRRKRTMEDAHNRQE
ncbi:hypothetical protein M758_7G045100 [Ceratodon purpureus]|nr:hypothetical protein M758_7G045100 [Ceratodon purpureus]